MNVPTSTDGPQESQAMDSSQNVSIAETRKGTYQAKYEDEQIRRQEFSRKRTRGYVIECDGEHAIITAKVRFNDETAENYWAVGQLVSIRVGKNRVVGLTCRVDSTNGHWDAEGENDIRITLELVGEIVDCGGQGADRFSSGIASYPQMGCIAHRIRAADLEIIYKTDGDTVVKVGQLTQDQSVAAKIEIDKLLSRHFAVVGTTGVGKSTSVTLLLRKVIAVRPDIRVLMLDPHNEFATAFPNDSVVVDSTNLNLPYWLFKLDEFAEVVFRGQDGFDPEIELLRDILPLAKEQYRAEAENNGSSLVRKKVNRSNLTADMPVPYRLADLIKIIDDRLGQLEGKSEKPYLKSLKYRLESISTDPRFKFMFEHATSGGDVLEEIVSKIFRVPQQGKPICVLEMSGLPTEVVNSVVSVLSRMAFDLAANSDGAIQTLVVCEEAHRYIPADEKAGFWPTRQAIARIAKEGRKYGVFLSIITQRPGELDPTILSQCNTMFAMRLGNERDQEIIRGAVTNGAKSTIGFLSSIANRECIAFGEAIQTPMRLTFETIRAEDLPGAHIYEQQKMVKAGIEVSLSSVLRRMRQEDRRRSDDDQNTSADPMVQHEKLAEQARKSAPGEDINQILNAAYSPKNSSLKPDLGNAAPSLQPTPGTTTATSQPPGTTPSAPTAGRTPNPAPFGASNPGVAPAVSTPPNSLNPAPAPSPAAGATSVEKPRSGVANNLIKNFRTT